MKASRVIKWTILGAVAVGVGYVVYRVTKAGPQAGTVLDRIKATVSGATMRLPPPEDPTFLSSPSEVADAVDKYGLPPGVTSKDSMSADWSFDTTAGKWVLEKG